MKTFLICLVISIIAGFVIMYMADPESFTWENYKKEAVEFAEGAKAVAADANVTAQREAHEAIEVTIEESKELVRQSPYIFVYLAMWVIVIVALVRAVKVNRKLTQKIFNDYYAQKRKEFPWLDNYLNTFGNPANVRAGIAFKNFVGTMIIAFVVAFFAPYLLNALLPYAWRIPDIYFGSGVALIPTITGSLLLWFAYYVSVWCSKKMIGKPATSSDDWNGLTLECPSCHCPHAWGMVAQTITLKGEQTTTKTKETWEEDGHGKRIFGTTERDVKVTKKYYVDVSRDFVCDNCEHTYHGEYNDVYDTRPTEGSWTYDPPTRAWRMANEK